MTGPQVPALPRVAGPANCGYGREHPRPYSESSVGHSLNFIVWSDGSGRYRGHLSHGLYAIPHFVINGLTRGIAISPGFVDLSGTEGVRRQGVSRALAFQEWPTPQILVMAKPDHRR